MEIVIKKMETLNAAIYALTVALIASFYINATSSYAKYVYILIAVAILIVYAMKNNMNVELYFDPYQRYIVAFAIICYISVVAAVHRADAIESGNAIVKILICFYPLYISYKSIGTRALLKVIMWGGYAVSLYTFFYFGVSTVINNILSATRMASEFSNSNSVGLLATISFIITFYIFLKEKFSLYMLLAAADFVIIAFSGSRKGIIILILGFLLIYGNELIERKSLNSLFKFAFITVVIVAAIMFVIKLNIFTLINQRMEGVYAFFRGEGDVDNSTIVRHQLIQLGLKLFRENPILGVGMDNTHFYVYQLLGENFYLHNNYVELLAGSGIVGFLTYYSGYMFVLYKLFKRRKNTAVDDKFAAILILLLLIIDIASVNYYDKTTYIYMCFLFLQAANFDKSKIPEEEPLPQLAL